MSLDQNDDEDVLLSQETTILPYKEPLFTEIPPKKKVCIFLQQKQ